MTSLWFSLNISTTHQAFQKKSCAIPALSMNTLKIVLKFLKNFQILDGECLKIRFKPILSGEGGGGGGYGLPSVSLP